jgi:UDP-galactopyranose mutase
MPAIPDLVVCLADRRWSCYYDRSQILLSQCARERRAVFVEEPELDTGAPDVELSETRSGVITVIPHMPSGLTRQGRERAQRRAIDFVLAYLGCHRPVLWYYAPKAIAVTDHIDASAVVYDWVEHDQTVEMLGHRHQQLLQRADVVFTDGPPDHRRLVHHNVHAFAGEPSWQDTWRRMWTHVEQAIANRSMYQSGGCMLPAG